ncbi:MAG TPA: hypothetical protein VF693_05025 [Allosphingosinicella sp.]|jgi:tetratricopeptide (TPR) repeat protein
MAVGGNGNARRGDRLRSWKEIASFFGTDERTVRRWERRGLPVRRVPGGGRATIYADVAELEGWMRRSEVAAEPAPTAQALPRRWLVAIAAALALIATGTVWVALRPDAGRAAAHVPTQAVADLYLAGRYNWERRTPESLARAAQLFRRAIAADPAYAEAYTGLADTYLLLREYAGMPDAEAYPVARDAAERALALDPDAADAHAARAFVTMYWDQDFRRGLDGFRRAVALDPRSARVRHWHATALLHAARLPDALAEIDQAQRLAPDSNAILADKALILFYGGRAADARRLLAEIEQAQPDYYSPHAYLAVIYLAEEDYAAWLGQARAAARLARDADRLEVIDAAAQGLARGGPRPMLEAMAARQATLLGQGRESAFELAATYALLGDRGRALRYFRLAAARREPEALGGRVDVRFRRLHRDAEFRRLAARIGAGR